MKEKIKNEYANSKLNILNSKFQTLKSDHKGITLIALVVTIIVLLILAGVTINLVLSDGGLFSRAQEAQSKQKEAEIRDQIGLLLADYQVEKYTRGTDLKTYLEGKEGTIIDSVTENGDSLEVEIDGFKVLINKGTLGIGEITNNGETGGSGSGGNTGGGQTPEPTDVAVTSITINKTETTIIVDDTETLTITSIEPDNATDKSITWSSNASDIAEVSQTGVVTAKKVGTAIITATANGGENVSASCTVTVDGMLADGTFDERTGVNSPQLVKGMTAIYWDGDSWEEPDTEEEWYNYDEKRWANAKSTDGSFWVWIPRYGYQITSNWHTTSTTGGNINVVFLKNKTNEPAKEDDADMTWANASGLNNWNVHPAFTGTPSIGGWSADSYGIWVAKFEPSLAGSTSTTEADGRYNNSDKTFQIKPGVTSWRNISVNNIFTVCQNYNLIDNSHMMKNSEWGAVAYLAQSSYGKNAEVAVNQCSAYITGGGPGTGDNGVYASSTYTYSSSTFNTTYAYTTTQGKKASTTGNEYGIYDMSGGSWEYTASYVNNGHDYITNASYGGVIGESSTDAWLRQVYSSASSNGTSNQQTDYNRNSGVYGDAVYETSNGYNSSSGSWYQDYSYFPYSGTPFFLRGGNYSYTTGAGLFSFSSSNGNADADSGFRPVGLAL